MNGSGRNNGSKPTIDKLVLPALPPPRFSGRDPGTVLNTPNDVCQNCGLKVRPNDRPCRSCGAPNSVS